MLHFARLRLSGFKSFVEPTELVIEPGLTGIVGPNGCGKSNIVEALRWVMGEISAKQMRGGEMDDVIFGGTQSRPPRNIAEVQVFLDNRQRTAPAAFNESEEIEVVRRIERGEGSNYRINGRDARARDVQLLFADAATGARSTALVGQGRIAALINAKPTDRRALLEEAAGITGLHSRRHEAELRLRAADSNLERLDDVLQTMAAQLQGLKRQARQASRYRNLSDHIRRAEAILLHLRWQAALGALADSEALFRAAEQLVASLTGRVAAAASAEAEAASALPPLRQAEAEVAAELHRYAVARDALDAEERRTAEALEVVRTRLQQIAADQGREEGLKTDAAAASARLAEEAARLAAEQQGEAAAVADASTSLAGANAELAAADAAFAAVVQEIAAGEARAAALARQSGELETRRARLLQRKREIGEECARLEAEAGSSAALEEARQALRAADAHAETTRLAALAAEEAHAEAQAAEAAARDALQGPEMQSTGLAARVQALSALLGADNPAIWPPLIDAVTVEPGFEAALGAALGDDLAAPLDEGAPVHWRALPPLDYSLTLPAGCEPLAKYVRGPAALDRRLAQVGVVPDQATGKALSARLAQGQRLVGKDGALWRWDGFTHAAGATTPAVKRLGQKQELEELRAARACADVATEAARAALTLCQSRTRDSLAAERRARETAREALAALNAAREAETRLAQKVAQQSSRLATLADSADQLAVDLAEAERQAAETAEALAALPDLAAARRNLESCRAQLAEARNRQSERQTAHDRLTNEAAARNTRLEAIAHEGQSWESRTAAAERQLAELAERKAAAEREQRELAARPAEIASRRSLLLDRIAEAEERRKAAADRLAAAETHLAEADKALKAAEEELHTAREERVRREAAVAAAEQGRSAIAERIAERLDCAPEACLALAELKPGDTLPDLAHVEMRLQRLVNERETMGPVNLRADAEAREIEAQVSSLETERADLVGAIARLRHGIAELNREGRERLLSSFAAANEHFTALFTRLFGGGRAHLELTESPDPLEAGLEIMASPPGKKLQVLSLLSGGEQALTALALLFAVFLTNPAPICVLDEVDAPLDDANVDRFCTLLEEIAHHSSTRFLLITHHRMTMTRMDRLFGVTMPERGLSQLVSVDLEAADSLRATA
ncbi:MAG TPA: AAA family ATPase [Alphaproteobacteria bacterium]|nr:AAA family ATPase [Alphaproteobacteria bacterium]